MLTTLPGVCDDGVDCAHRFLKLCLLRYLVCVMTVLTARTASSYCAYYATVLIMLPGVRDDGVDWAHRLLKLCLLHYLVCVMTVLTGHTAS